jgi:hypothetical protein
MMSLVDVISKIIGLPVIVSVASLIFLIINNINIRDVEKMLLTNYQRLQIFLGNIFINWIIYSILISFILIYENKIDKGNTDGTFITIGLMALFLSFIVYMPIQMGVYFSPMITTISVEKDGDKWELMRVVGKSKVLLRRGSGANKEYHDIIKYYDLSLMKNQEINLKYELKKNGYFNILRRFLIGEAWWYLFLEIIISLFIIITTVFFVFEYTNSVMIFAGIFIWTLTIIVNIQILFLRKAKKIYPKIFES